MKRNDGISLVGILAIILVGWLILAALPSFNLIGFIVLLVVGFLAGLIANAIVGRSNSSVLMNTLLGISGAILGSWVFRLLQISAGGFIGELIMATIGAMIVIWLINLFTGNNKRVRF